MPFRKGDKKPIGSGRKKGQVAKYKLPSVNEVLKKHGIDPLEELIKIASDPNTPVEAKRKIHADILGYTRGKVRTEVENIPAPSKEVPESEVPSAQLLSIVKGQKK